MIKCKQSSTHPQKLRNHFFLIQISFHTFSVKFLFLNFIYFLIRIKTHMGTWKLTWVININCIYCYWQLLLFYIFFPLFFFLLLQLSTFEWMGQLVVNAVNNSIQLIGFVVTILFFIIHWTVEGKLNNLSNNSYTIHQKTSRCDLWKKTTTKKKKLQSMSKPNLVQKVTQTLNIKWRLHLYTNYLLIFHSIKHIFVSLLG